MAEFSGNVWLLLAAIAFACVLAVLHSFASMIRSHANVRDLKANVTRLRAEYAERLRRLEELEGGDVIVVAPVSDSPEPTKQAA